MLGEQLVVPHAPGGEERPGSEELLMDGSYGATSDREIYVENFAAELTEAAYVAALRHGVAGSWVDLELDLWHALADTIRKRGQEWPGSV